MKRVITAGKREGIVIGREHSGGLQALLVFCLLTRLMVYTGMFMLS